MSTTAVQRPQRQQQEESQPEVQLQRTHPRYKYDSLWQSDIARCELGQLAVLGVHCRCGSALFGKRRGDDFAFFAGLAVEDPHSFRRPVQTSARASSLVKSGRRMWDPAQKRQTRET